MTTQASSSPLPILMHEDVYTAKPSTSDLSEIVVKLDSV